MKSPVTTQLEFSIGKAQRSSPDFFVVASHDLIYNSFVDVDVTFCPRKSDFTTTLIPGSGAGFGPTMVYAR